MIGVLGISHKTAPLNIRELFSIDKLQINDFAEFIQNSDMLSELVILSTCNRTEIYFYLEKPDDEIFNKLVKLYHSYLRLKDNFSKYFYSHKNDHAVKHLFSVTSGLDSMVIGEYQIVSQVKEAFVHCTENSWTDAILMRLFQKSFETSKQVRTQTAIQKGATSISYLAVDKCQRILGDLKDKKVLIIGTGETGRLVLQKMKKSGMTDFTFTNRTTSKMENLAKENSGNTVRFQEFREHLAEFDIVVTATNAGQILISTDDINDSVTKRTNKKQVFVDLSVPRNMDHTSKIKKGINLISIDDLQELIESNAVKREESIQEATEIINNMTKSYLNWYKNRSLKPIIQTITRNIQDVHKNEIKGYSECYNTETYHAIDQYANRLTQKYIRNIIKNLVGMNEKGESMESIDAIRELFIFESKNE